MIIKRKDVIYEIVVPESGYYTIQMTTPEVIYKNNSIVNFNYEIYSYNMYNGDYIVTSGSGQSGSTFSETVNLTAYDDYNDGSDGWQYQAYKHYIRLDFGRMNTSDVSVNVSITHTHEYTDHFETESSTQHTAYCWCGDEIFETHYILNGECSKCGEPHTHSYLYHHIRMNNRLHRSYCCCGEYTLNAHAIYREDLISGNGTATCMICNGSATDGLVIASVNNLPHTDNGSYIMPNGVIVLVDEDIEAYFDGTLVFYNSNDNLETQ